MLLAGEVGLACSLLVGSILLVRSFAELAQTDPGLAGDGVIRVRVTSLDEAFGSPVAMAQAIRSIDEQLTARPDIAEVALSRELPPEPGSTGLAHLGPAGTKPNFAASIRTHHYRVSPEFLPLYRIPVVAGRGLQSNDTERDAVIGERLAGLLWPGDNPLGRTFAVGTLPGEHRVVGVAAEIRLPTIDRELDLPEYYTPLGSSSRTLYANIRCRGTCPAESDLRDLVRRIDPRLGLLASTAAGDQFLQHLKLPQAIAETAGLFAVIAVVTSAGGLFSVLTYAVGRRRREFGIRAALGASPRHIRRLVMQDGLTVVGIGIAAGGVGGWMVARSLAAFHYGVTTTDPITWAAVLGTIATASLLAAWRPARQAARVNPVTLLRSE
jgi:hypothetical protein